MNMETDQTTPKNEKLLASAEASIEGSVDQVAEMVNQKEMCFLRSAAGIAGDNKINRGEAPGFAAAAAEKGDALEAQFGGGG